MAEYKKAKRFKRYEISKTDSHITYLQIADSGDFTIGEIYGDEYHCMLSVRGDDVPKIISILCDKENFKFPELKEVEE